MSEESAYLFAKRNIESGTAIPTLGFARPSESFYKLVPSGQSPGRSSYYLSGEQYAAFRSGNYDAFDSFALPDKSLADSYDIFEYAVRQNHEPLVFFSEIAPAMSKVNGLRMGGLQQAIIPNSNALELKGLLETIGRYGQ